MGRGVFITMPAHGHLNPTLPVVAELVRRGESIDYYGAESFRAAIESAGARFRPLDGRYAEFEKTLDPGDGLFALGEFVAEATLDALPRVEAELRDARPDYVLYDSMTPLGRFVATRLGLPAVATFPSFGTRPDALPLPPVPVLLLAMGGPLKLRRNLRWHRRRAAVAKSTAERFSVDELGFGNIVSNPTACNLVFTSERFQVHRERLDERYHFVGPCLGERPADPSFPLSRLDGKRVIYISLGTAFNAAVGFFHECLRAFAGREETVVMSIGSRVDAAAFGQIPENFIVRAHVPQLDVLRRASLFITHAGMNGVSEALTLGVPMLAYPQAADQFLVARRIAALGVGRRIGRRDVTAPRLRQLATEVFDDAKIRASVADVGASLRDAGGPARAADIVLSHVARASDPSRRGQRRATAGSGVTAT